MNTMRKVEGEGEGKGGNVERGKEREGIRKE